MAGREACQTCCFVCQANEVTANNLVMNGGFYEEPQRAEYANSGGGGGGGELLSGVLGALSVVQGMQQMQTYGGGGMVQRRAPSGADQQGVNYGGSGISGRR